MSIFSVQERIAIDLLRKKGVVIVCKATRAGCSLSLTKVSLELGKKVVVIYPTKRIAREIQTKIPELLPDQQPRIAIIWPNSELCRKCDPKLELKFQLKKDCTFCEYVDQPRECVFQNLILEDFDIYCLTYDKLQALLASSSPESEKLMNKLLGCDVIVLDEFTRAVIRDVPTIEVVTISKEDSQRKRFRMSERLRAAFPELLQHLDSFLSEFWTAVMNFLIQFESVERSGVYQNRAIAHLSEDERKSLFYRGWRTITRLTEMGKNTAELQEIFLALFGREIVVNCENGSTKVTPRIEDALGYMTDFCHRIGEQKLVVTVDSHQPSIDFERLFGQKVRHELWGEEGDPLHTNRAQLIVCDTAHWGARDFLKDKKLQDRVESFVKSFQEAFPSSQLLIVATNKRMTGVVSQWKSLKDARITWFRSDLMRGVSVEDRRVMVCVGGPYIPRRAYDASAKSFRIEAFARDLERLDDDGRTLAISRLLRLDDTKSELINSIGRVKDPEGKERSVVFTLGMQKHEVNVLLKQDAPVSKPHLVSPFWKGGLHRDGLWIAKLWLDEASVDVKDLPIVARIIRYTQERKAVSPSQVIPRHTKRVLEKATQYRDVLEHYGVRIIAKRGGMSLESNE